MSNIKVVSPDSLGPSSTWKYIGHGHFGDVFKVKHKELKIHLAVKKLKENTSYLVDELLAEAEKIKHASENPFVIQLFGIIKAPPCIVMDLMENGCLCSLMERVKEIPWALKYRLLHEVALGMNWLHSLSPPLLHLDLKPRNVLLNEELHIRITDFGLSKYKSSSTVLSDNEACGGTIEYMPPEAFQDGYSPSTSSDIYSFAILSAVVLRGGDPYPVQLSALISIHVPQGQRPSFESLENINSVKNLKKSIAFTKCCWHNDKLQRPSFDECCNKWEEFKSAYKDKEIRDAVVAVQNMMDCTDSSGSTTDVQQNASVPNTRDMSDLIKTINDICIEEHPSAKLEAIPSTVSSQPRSPVQRSPPAHQPRPNVIYHGPSTPNYRTGTQFVRNPVIIQKQYIGPLNPNLGQAHQPGQAGPIYRTNPKVYMTENVRSPQTAQNPFTRVNSRQAYPQMVPNTLPRYNFGTPPFLPVPALHRSSPQDFSHNNFSAPPTLPTDSRNISLTNNMGPCQIGDNNEMSYGEKRYNQNTFNNPMTQHPGYTGPSGYNAPSQRYNISINNSNGPLQIGDNNKMIVRQSSQHQGSNTHPITPQPGRPAHTSSFAPAESARSPQLPSTSQVSFPTKAREGFSDSTQPIQETERQTDQPLEIPTMQDTTASNSLQGTDNIDSSSSPQEQENNSKK
ncbi:uncharacterized protein ACMZJ9_001133 [Mantella aurantiaca]